MKDEFPGDAVAVGNTVYLRPVRLSDATERYRDWLNDPEVNRYLEIRGVQHTVASVADYIRSFQADPDSVFLAIVVREGHIHVGNVKIGPIDRRQRLADVGIMIGDKSYWGRGIASETLKLVAEHAFRELKLRQLTAGIHAANVASLRAFQNAGYVIDRVKERHVLDSGECVEGYLLVSVNPDAEVGNQP